MKSVFEYFDYREFLRDFYHEKKSRMSFFSYRLIGQAVGMDSSHLIKVLQGTLHISVGKIPAFIKMCKLSAQEAVYFETLVNFNRAKSEMQRKLSFEKLFRISRVNSHCIQPCQYEFFRKWYYSAVWSLIQIRPQRPDFDLLASECEPPITPPQAREAVKLLTKLKLVSMSENGEIRVISNHLAAPDKWTSEAIANYQREMFKWSVGAIDHLPKDRRDISSVALTFKEENIEQIRAMIGDFRKSLVALSEEQSDPDTAYQLNVQFFPITRNVRGRR